LPTVPRLARVKATQEGAVFADRGQRGPQGGLPEVLFLYVTIAALCGGVVLGGLVLWLRSCGRGSAPDESEPLPSQPNQDVPG
jgi:hypothetical protein